MDLYAVVHQVRRKNVVLKHAVYKPEDDDDPQVLESREPGDDQHDDSRDERSDHGNEFEYRGLKCEQYAIGHADDSQKRAVDDDADERQRHQDANIMAQQDVNVLEDFV